MSEEGDTSFLSQNRYTSPYYSDGRTPPVQRFAIQIYLLFEGFVVSHHWSVIFIITIIATILIHWAFVDKRKPHQEHPRSYYNSLYSFLQSILPSSAMALLNTIISIWIYFYALFESATQLRLHIKTGWKELDSQDSPDLSISMQNRGFTSSLPDLEELVQDSHDNKQVQETNLDETEELQPAFTDVAQYPEGWLTFDPKYGLIEIKELNRIRKIHDTLTSNAGVD